jgi:hypothetical protein
MADVERVSVQEARREVADGRAVLVCAYDDEQKCGQMLAQGAITLAQLQARVSSLPKEQELIFYCG